MAEKGEANRQRIVDAANALFYQKGYNQTSFSDIAEAAGVARGNFYYYFKTKDDILAAVIIHRMHGIELMLEDWERQFHDPRARLKRYVTILLNSRDDILRYGCPLGTLNVELSKTQLQQQSQAREMFELFRIWLERQFHALGHQDDARDLALQLLARSQGISLLTNVYSDPAFLQREAERLSAWVDAL